MSEANRPPESIPDLADYTSHELLDELMSRFDSSVFIGQQPRTDKLSMYHRRWWGNHMECHGLCGYMQGAILANFNEECEEAEE